jgi:hypothetical protein
MCKLSPLTNNNDTPPNNAVAEITFFHNPLSILLPRQMKRYHLRRSHPSLRPRDSMIGYQNSGQILED